MAWNAYNKLLIPVLANIHKAGQNNYECPPHDKCVVTCINLWPTPLLNLQLHWSGTHTPRMYIHKDLQQDFVSTIIYKYTKHLNEGEAIS